MHTAEHLAAAMFFLGVPPQEIPRASLNVSRPRSSPERYAVIHPFASAADKAWPAENFRAVATFLERELHLPVTIIGAANDDVSRFAGFDCQAGRSLEETKSILAGASLFIGNDSGPAHMAAAFGRPVVVLFGTSDPVAWAPWRTRSETFVSPEGIGRIPIESVTAAAQRLLSLQEVPA